MSALPWILGSIGSSVSIIILNKSLFSKYNFHSPVTLCLFHLLITTGVLEVFRRMGLYERVKVSAWDKWFTSFLNTIALFLSNWNLRYNSIGFYQLSKLMVIPCIIIIEFVTQKKCYDFRIIFSLILLLIGVGLFSINEVSLNFFGTCIASLTIFVASNSQVRCGMIQKKYEMNGLSFQDMMNIPMIVMSVIAFILFESYGPNSPFFHHFSKGEVLMIFLTGLVSIGVNVFAQGLIGKTSALTFQVVGHCKSILIFSSGLILFPFLGTRKQFIQQIIGLSTSMIAVILYSYFKIKDKEKEEKKISLNNEEEDINFIIDGGSEDLKEIPISEFEKK